MRVRPSKKGFGMTLVSLSVMLLSLGPIQADASAASWVDPFLSGDPTHYAQPEPVETVQRASTIKLNPSMARLSPGTTAKFSAANSGAQIELLQVVRSDEIAGVPAPPGMEAVILFTRWQNVHAKQKIAKSSLESAADRSYGAGGLSAGGGSSGEEEMVEMDVAYKVPIASRHLWLIAGGEAFQLRPESGELPDGLSPDKPFGIARQGETREARMAWFLPKGMADIEFRLFDYENGHVSLSVAGDMKKAEIPAQTARVDAGKTGELELAVLGLRTVESYAGQKAPDGWRFAAVDLLGKSIAKQNNMGALVFADPTQYVWLTGDGGSLRYGLPPEDGSGNIVFTPEVASRQTVAFLVPDGSTAFRLGLRGRAEVISLKATTAVTEAIPAPTTQVNDEGAMTLGFLGMRRENGITIVDLLATPQSGGKGVDINPAQQFLLKAGKDEYHPDPNLTRRLFNQPPDPFVLPPGTPVRFALAFSLPVDAAPPSLLRYRGFKGDADLALDGKPIAEAQAGSPAGMSAQALAPVVVAPAPAAEATAASTAGAVALAPAAETGVAAGAASSEAAKAAPARPAFVPPSEKPKMMAITLLAFDVTKAIAELEPNNKPEQATPLASGLAAKGSLGPDDEYDWFTFKAEGEPQLWSFEASGPGPRLLGVYAEGERRLAEFDSRGQASIRVDNVILLPGQYWIKLRRTGPPGDYTVRAVPLGRPDRFVEFEPNDHPSQAHILHFGEPRTGLIGHQDDVDTYRFSVDVETHLALTLSPPADLRLSVKLEGSGLNVRGSRSAAKGEPSRYETLLQPGEYLVSVQGEGPDRSESPYELRLDRLDPFVLPVDLSPNDSAVTARKLEGRLDFAGYLGDFRSEDWFEFPEIKVPTRLTLTLDGDTRLSIRKVAGDATPSIPTEEDVARRTATSHTFTAALEPGSVYLLQVTGEGAYHVSLGYSQPVVGTAPLASSDDIELAIKGEVPVFGAYRKETQQSPLTLTVTNRTGSQQNISFAVKPGALGWEAGFDRQSLSIAPGVSAEIRSTLRALPDRTGLESMPVYFHAEGSTAGGGTLAVPIRASCESPPQDPQPYRPLPKELLGGLNLAWSGLGSNVQGVDDRASDRLAVLFDEMAPLNQRYEIKPRDLPADITIKLAGETAADIAGITLFPGKAGSSMASQMPFSVLISQDGTSFTTAYSGLLQSTETEQAFVFAKPVKARFMRLHLASPTTLYGAPGVILAEWKVIAVPGAKALGEKPLNIANPELGGHVVWSSWNFSGQQLMLTEADEASSTTVEKLTPIEWVVGFHHNRAAGITHLQWVESVKTANYYRRPDMVSVAGSMEGPNGPWQPIADWQLKRNAEGMAELVLEKPTWVRFVRFALPGSDKQTSWKFAETLRIFEQGESGNYRSMLGEWGHYQSAAIFEALNPNKIDTRAVGGGTSRDSAPVLPAEKTSDGRVQVKQRVEWYRVEAPQKIDRLEFAFAGEGVSRLEISMEDATGNEVSLERGDDVDGARTFHAKVVPGASYFLKVAEAKRSVMIVWDNSGSVGDYHETLYRAITRFADDIQPDGPEVVNLMPLQDRTPNPLLPDWTSNPLDIKAAIGGYDRHDQSSDSETTLLGASKLLAKQPGSRAIVLLTDAESPGDSQSSSMWEMFRIAEPRIFSLELQLAPDAVKTSHYQDLMQDWARVNHGEYAVFRNQGDLDAAFDRATCLIRRPAEYSVSWRPAPGTGQLRVAWEDGKAMSGATIELILDASGSMKSAKNKVDGKLKIDVAKEVMQQIVGLLPADTQVGLRIYGHRKKDGTKGACEDSELAVPIGTLDGKRLLERIKTINALGGTPIAYSLLRAGEDLAPIKGPRHIVLITDGKEECHGDPAAAVKQIQAQGVDARIDIVGFALADKKDKDDMSRVADSAGGRFFDAQNRDALAKAIAESLAMPFDVLDSRENKVGNGLTGQLPYALYQGNYTVIVHTAKGDVTVRDVPLQENALTTVFLAREGDGIRVRFDAPAKR